MLVETTDGSLFSDNDKSIHSANTRSVSEQVEQTLSRLASDSSVTSRAATGKSLIRLRAELSVIGSFVLTADEELTDLVGPREL